MPTISTSSPTVTFPLSIRPVATVPRPVIEKTSSIAIKNGLSTSLSGSGILSSTAFINSSTLDSQSESPSNAFRPETLTIGTSLNP